MRLLLIFLQLYSCLCFSGKQTTSNNKNILREFVARYFIPVDHKYSRQIVKELSNIPNNIDAYKDFDSFYKSFNEVASKHHITQENLLNIKNKNLDGCEVNWDKLRSITSSRFWPPKEIRIELGDI